MLKQVGALCSSVTCAGCEVLGQGLPTQSGARTLPPPVWLCASGGAQYSSVGLSPDTTGGWEGQRDSSGSPLRASRGLGSVARAVGSPSYSFTLRPGS